jgi:hypothetical protein
MTMGWMETIRFIGLDLQVATVFGVASLDVAARTIKSAWRRTPRDAASRVPIRDARLPSAPALTQSVPRPASQRFATAPGRP